MRSAEQVEEVQHLIARGLNDCVIARRTGIPRTTVRDWRCRPQVQPRLVSDSPCGVIHNFDMLPSGPYCYLLGLYLGDGCISRDRRVWRLRITLDQKYPAIIDRCRAALEILMPSQRAGIVKKIGCVDVSLYSKHWPCLFPQHGHGTKHNRRIALEPWQQELVDQATEEFVLGLIHSDGCRVVANDRGVTSIRYHFSNMSEDIHALVHRRTRCPRHSLDPVEQEGRLHLSQGRDCPPRHVRRAQDRRGTVGWCPLHGVGDRRSSHW